MRLINWFFKPKTYKPKERILYAITNGIYKGVCLIFIKPNEHPKNGIYAAMAIGDKNMDGGMETMQIPEIEILNGLKGGILDEIKKVPKDLYWLCCEEYTERQKRLKEKNNESID